MQSPTFSIYHLKIIDLILSMQSEFSITFRQRSLDKNLGRDLKSLKTQRNSSDYSMGYLGKTARRKMVVKEAIYNVLGLSQLDIGDVLLNWQGEDQFYFHSFSLNSLTKLCKKSKLKPVQFGKISSKKGGTNIFVVAVKQS